MRVVIRYMENRVAECVGGGVIFRKRLLLRQSRLYEGKGDDDSFREACLSLAANRSGAQKRQCSAGLQILGFVPEVRR